MKLLLQFIATITLCLWAVSVSAQSASHKLNDEGIALLRAKQYDQSVAEFEEAIKAATPNSQEQLDAARNITLPLEQLGDKEQIWNAQKRAALIDHELTGAAVPQEYTAATAREAADKKAEQESLDPAAKGKIKSATQQPSGQTSTDGASAAAQSTKLQQTRAAVQASPPGYDAAVKLMSESKYSQAAPMFEKIIKSNPTNADSHLNLGSCYQHLKKYDAAMQQYEWVGEHGNRMSTKFAGLKAARLLRDARAGICPGNCLKLSTPGWGHGPGLDPNHLWMTFRYNDGRTMSWTTGHIGEVIEYVNGEPVNKGKCPICGGTGKVPPLR